MALVRAIILYIAWNATGATLHMLDKQETESLTDSKFIFFFTFKHNNNTTVARHFHSHNDQLDPKMTIHILEYIRLLKDVPRSNPERS